jgi:transposase InsO family protein
MGIKPKRTRPYRPRTNGKIERFHRTMADGWAFRRMFPSELARRQALPAWLHEYNRRVRLFACSPVRGSRRCRLRPRVCGGSPAYNLPPAGWLSDGLRPPQARQRGVAQERSALPDVGLPSELSAEPEA